MKKEKIIDEILQDLHTDFIWYVTHSYVKRALKKLNKDKLEELRTITKEKK